MGFGFGQTTYWREDAHDANGKRVAKTMREDMVAHVWNAQSQDFARTSNGNFAFVGDTLYSYGRGWIVAKIFRDVALINDERVSVTTTGHESSARRACSNRTRFELPSFPSSLADSLDSLESRGWTAMQQREAIRRMLADDSLLDIMRSVRMEPGESLYGRWNQETNEYEKPEFRETFGEWLCSLYGLRPAVARNAAAKLIVARKRAAEAAARKERDLFIRGSANLADMSGSDFRQQISIRDSQSYMARHNLANMAKRLRKARLNAGLSETRRKRLWEREKIVRERLADVDRLSAIASRRSRLASLIRYVRQQRDLLAISPNRPLGVWSSATWRTIASNLTELSACAMLPAGSRVRLAGLGAACKDAAYQAELREAEDRRREVEDRERYQAEKREAWLAGDDVALPRGTWSREDGTPYLRVFGGELQTSWGASVPLAHAVKVFRFVKLCRERGEGWNRNGKTIRVGHFQVDSVSASGDFVAGCHRFAWTEIERVAVAAGVYQEAASAEAVEESGK